MLNIRHYAKAALLPGLLTIATLVSGIAEADVVRKLYRAENGQARFVVFDNSLVLTGHRDLVQVESLAGLENNNVHKTLLADIYPYHLTVVDGSLYFFGVSDFSPGRTITPASAGSITTRKFSLYRLDSLDTDPVKIADILPDSLNLLEGQTASIDLWNFPVEHKGMLYFYVQSTGTKGACRGDTYLLLFKFEPGSSVTKLAGSRAVCHGDLVSSPHGLIEYGRTSTDPNSYYYRTAGGPRNELILYPEERFLPPWSFDRYLKFYFDSIDFAPKIDSQFDSISLPYSPSPLVAVFDNHVFYQGTLPAATLTPDTPVGGPFPVPFAPQTTPRHSELFKIRFSDVPFDAVPPHPSLGIAGISYDTYRWDPSQSPRQYFDLTPVTTLDDPAQLSISNSSEPARMIVLNDELYFLSRNDGELYRMTSADTPPELIALNPNNPSYPRPLGTAANRLWLQFDASSRQQLHYLKQGESAATLVEVPDGLLINLDTFIEFEDQVIFNAVDNTNPESPSRQVYAIEFADSTDAADPTLQCTVGTDGKCLLGSTSPSKKFAKTKQQLTKRCAATTGADFTSCKQHIAKTRRLSYRWVVAIDRYGPEIASALHTELGKPEYESRAALRELRDRLRSEYSAGSAKRTQRYTRLNLLKRLRAER